MEKDRKDLLAKNEELLFRLEEAEEALSAIRRGEVDALVVSSGGAEERVFTLEGADQPYRILVETMSEGAATLAQDSTILFCNTRLARLLDMPLEKILGTSLLSHIAPGDASALTALLEKTLEGDCLLGDSSRAEFALMTGKGESVPVLLSCCSLDLSGKRGISTIVTDLSEQKRVEEIIAAGQLASSILEQAGESIIVCDKSGRVIRASRQAHELFGKDPLFRPFHQLGLLRESLTGRAYSVAGPLGGQTFEGLEVVFHRPDRQRHLLLNARPLIRQQEILGCVLTLTDITERKQGEEELKTAKKTADEANRAKSEFLANMSHEIRTPMTAFMAAIEHLKELDRNPERLHLLDMADRSAHRLRVLIEEILDFSRIEARRIDLCSEPFDLRACVHDAIDMFTLSAREKNLKLESEMPPDLPRIVVGDPNRLGQVLINLIGNAVKFTEEGEIHISVRSRNGFLEFAVSDKGMGIPEEKRDLIFQSFSQVDASFTRRFEGTGLGLAISKGLVELMGGEISFQSQMGKGSTFTFSLPLKTSERQIPVPAEVEPVELSEKRPAASILLAEDDPMIREMLTIMLRKGGWKADTAESGREAFDKWESGNFDIIFMDLQMPEMNGLEATRAIRKRESEGGKRTCIVGLTGHVSSETKAECLASGMDQVLIKPVQMKDLYSAINRCAPN